MSHSSAELILNIELVCKEAIYSLEYRDGLVDAGSAAITTTVCRQMIYWAAKLKLFVLITDNVSLSWFW